MLVSATRLVGMPVLSVRAGGAVSRISEIIVDPFLLKIMAFRLQGGVVAKGSADYMMSSSIREYSSYGIVIDDVEELVVSSDVVHLVDILEYNFSLIGMKVESRKGSKLGKIIDFTVDSDNFEVQQLIVKRPIIKSLMDPELTIARKEIVEVTNDKIIIKDEEKKLKEKATKEDFVPNFVNPFRNPESGFAPADRKSPGDKDIE